MKKAWSGLGVLFACTALAWPGQVAAGGAFCTPDWKPENPDLGCSSQIAIAPGNDSRVNLFLLLQDRAGNDGAGKAYPDLGWQTFLGRNFFRWSNLEFAWYPGADTDAAVIPDHFGTKCQTAETGEAAYLQALEDAGFRREGDRSFLAQSRSALTAVCDDGTAALGPQTKGGFFTPPRAFGGSATPAGAFHGYLEASTSFYTSDWDRADRLYRDLSEQAGNEWVRETALYMTARNALNQAIDGANDRWGWFDLGFVSAATAARAEAGFKAYLAAYPDGLYASSAAGLIRKSLWLQRDYAGLEEIYGRQLETVKAGDAETGALVAEIDDKYLVREGRDASSNPLLLAAELLMRMRSDGYGERYRPLTEAELAASAGTFSDHPEIWTLLQANHAFYVRGEPDEVLRLIPDGGHQERYTAIAFSQQFLRGLALHSLGDTGEAQFWQGMIGGAQGIWQRPAVELALARSWEQAGQLDRVFAAGSPIHEPRIRRILLGQSAGIEILKRQSRTGGEASGEHRFALFTALLKQLQHGQYAGFLEDQSFLQEGSGLGSDPAEESLWNIYDTAFPPLQLFEGGTWSDGFNCPSITQTALALQADPQSVAGRLCLGDFYRLNGFDDFAFGIAYSQPDGPAVLGSRDFYSGDPIPRQNFYLSIMNDRDATSDQRAYALFRAVRCYAPAGQSSCGGESAEKHVRAQWFRRLKRDYGGTKWAQELKYYW
ncbi:hypothetical protein [Pontixanthobacter luteolus]|uniref:hypothetical protein n=1 Tax=Pontixanthobacter luteolus TaxID=295089 RepID=UPI00230289A3|nr:hypothetical protein [Pontixanthobacter luteolus]